MITSFTIIKLEKYLLQIHAQIHNPKLHHIYEIIASGNNLVSIPLFIWSQVCSNEIETKLELYRDSRVNLISFSKTEREKIPFVLIIRRYIKMQQLYHVCHIMFKWVVFMLAKNNMSLYRVVVYQVMLDKSTTQKHKLSLERNNVIPARKNYCGQWQAQLCKQGLWVFSILLEVAIRETWT